jgi:hypothetical protein
MKIIITINDFKIELSDTTDNALKYSFTDIKEVINTAVKEYNNLKTK